MSGVEVQQLVSFYNSLTPEQKTLINTKFNFAQINIMTLSADEAKRYLNQMRATVATTSTNPLKQDVSARQEKLDAQKAVAQNVWAEARKAYYAQLSVLQTDKTDENQQKAEDLFFNMQLAGEHMVDATRRANDSAIMNITFRALG